jgi:hypothetical protein
MMLVGNSGPFLGNSFGAGGQDDLFSYNLAIESAPMGALEEGASVLRVLAEVSGLAGSRFGNNRHHGLLGIRVERGAGAIYVGASVGFVTANEDFGLRSGIIYAFEPSKWFE